MVAEAHIVGREAGGDEQDSFYAIARQTVAGLGWTAVAMLVAFAARIVLTRKMPPHEMGIVVTAQSFILLVLAIAELGIPEAVVRFVGLETGSKAAPKRTVQIGLKIAAATAGLTSLIVLAGLVGWFGATLTADAWWATVILTLGLPLLAIGDVLGAAYRGINRLATKLFVIDVARPGLVVIALLISPLAFTRHASYVAGLYVAGALIAAAGLWILFARDPRWRDHGSSSGRDLLRFGVPLAGAAVIAGPLVNSTLPMLLSMGPGPTAVALFTVALSLQAIVYMPVSVLEQAAVPTWARMASDETGTDLDASYRHFANLGFAAATSLSLVIISNDRALLTFLFGPTYEAASSALRAATAATLFGALTGPSEGMLRALGLTTAIFKARTAAAVVGVTAGVLLIPVYGLSGAVGAFALVQIAINALYGVILYKTNGIHPFRRGHATTAVIALAGLLTATALSAAYPRIAWIGAHALAVLVLAVNEDLRSSLRKLVLQ